MFDLAQIPGYCIAIEYCIRFEPLENDMEEFCSLKKGIFLFHDTPKDCEDKNRLVIKEKRTDKKE